MKRSISTGRFTFTSYEKGRSSMIPNWAYSFLLMYRRHTINFISSL
jgi:hypothetical protein